MYLVERKAIEADKSKSINIKFDCNQYSFDGHESDGRGNASLIESSPASISNRRLIFYYFE